MKKVISLLSFLFISCSAFCATWGLLSEVEDKPKTLYFIDRYAQNKVITYCIDDYFSKALSSTVVEEAFNSWPAAAVKAIKESGRDAEFKDIEPILSRKVRLQQVPCGKLDKGAAEGYSFFKTDKRTEKSKEDIRILFLSSADISTFCGDKYGPGCFQSGVRGDDGEAVLPALMALSVSDRSSDILKHEIGHAFGLSDQYFSARINSNPKYGTTKIYPSIMDENTDITCDDAEGFINSLDCHALGIKRGGKEGWKSLCPDSQEAYINCSAKNREPFMNISKDELSTSITSYNEDGSIDKTEQFESWGDIKTPHVFYYPNSSFSSIKRDKNNRVISFTDKTGNETKIDYSTPKYIRTFTLVRDGEKPATAPAIYKIVAGKTDTGRFFDMRGNVSGTGRSAISLYNNQKYKMTTIVNVLYISNYGGKDVYPLVQHTFHYWPDKNILLLKTSLDKIRQYVLISKDAQGDFVVSCMINGKSSKANCYCASVKDKVASMQETNLYHEHIASFIEKEEGLSDKIKLKYSKDLSRITPITISAKEAADVFVGYVDNFEDNYNWATGNSDQKEKKELLDSLKNTVQQASGGKKSSVLQTK